MTTSEHPAATVRTRRRRSRDRLESWKEIAAYLHRSVRTARRWELHEGLPIRRHHHLERGSIFAFKVEIDEWLKSREAEGGSGSPAGDSRATAEPPRLRIVAAGEPAKAAKPRTRHPSQVTQVSLEDILTACSDLICVFDQRGRYVISSRAGAQALGVKREEMIGRDWRELGLPAEAMAPFQRQVAEVFSRGRSIRTEVSYPTLLGHQIYEYILDPIRPDGGTEVTAVLAIVRAIGNSR